ncbi:MAG: MarR family transcriptional regulator [Nitrososphaera sp.]|jgi:MarR family transcriptional regulator for hemolysin
MRKLDLSESVGTLIALTAKSQERLAEIEMKKQLGLTPAQWKVILVLNITDGLTQKEIAEKISIDGSTLVPVLDKMEKEGLVERRADAKDRRNNRIFLTRKSESTVDSITSIIIQLRKKVYSGIPESEIDSAKNVVKSMMKNIESELNKIKTSKDNMS